MDTPFKRHNRYSTQAVWTREIRRYLLSKCQPPPKRTLDVGCGTGAVTADLPGQVYGMDTLYNDLQYAGEVSSGPRYLAADAYKIPFAPDTFDLVCCHFLLLWLKEPQNVLFEMTRVLKPDCRLILFAEPDYGGRIDFPYPLADLGQLQKMSLRNQGCDPEIGRKLCSMLIASGLDNIETGVIGGEWKADYSLPKGFASEWDTLLSDLQSALSPQETAFYTELDRTAWLEGTRVLYVPTFYAAGKKPLY